MTDHDELEEALALLASTIERARPPRAERKAEDPDATQEQATSNARAGGFDSNEGPPTSLEAAAMSARVRAANEIRPLDDGSRNGTEHQGSLRFSPNDRDCSTRFDIFRDR